MHLETLCRAEMVALPQLHHFLSVGGLP